MNNKVTLISSEKKEKGKNAKAIVMCNKCGKVSEMWLSHYYRGSSPCKCTFLASNNKRLYSIWINMKTRCTNKNTNGYKNYGGRGISICTDWSKSFEAFLDWALANGYDDNLTIDRIDVNMGYSPDNCRWATVEEQAQNKTTTILIDGTSLRKWCRDNNLNYKLVHQYHKRHPEKTIKDVAARYLNKAVEILEAE